MISHNMMKNSLLCPDLAFLYKYRRNTNIQKKGTLIHLRTDRESIFNKNVNDQDCMDYSQFQHRSHCAEICRSVDYSKEGLSQGIGQSWIGKTDLLSLSVENSQVAMRCKCHCRDLNFPVSVALSLPLSHGDFLSMLLPNRQRVDYQFLQVLGNTFDSCQTFHLETQSTSLCLLDLIEISGSVVRVIKDLA
jgi:hypothetical protein